MESDDGSDVNACVRDGRERERLTLLNVGTFVYEICRQHTRLVSIAFLPSLFGPRCASRELYRVLNVVPASHPFDALFLEIDFDLVSSCHHLYPTDSAVPASAALIVGHHPTQPVSTSFSPSSHRHCHHFCPFWCDSDSFPSPFSLSNPPPYSLPVSLSDLFSCSHRSSPAHPAPATSSAAFYSPSPPSSSKHYYADPHPVQYSSKSAYSASQPDPASLHSVKML